MPIYEYQCTACGHHFDTIQSFKDEALIHCPVCGEASLKKLISAPAFHLKGTGWYATDFKNPSKSVPEEKATDSEEKKPKTETGATEDLKKEKETVAVKETTESTPAKKTDKSD